MLFFMCKSNKTFQLCYNIKRFLYSYSNLIFFVLYKMFCYVFFYFLPSILFMSLFCFPILKWLSSVLIFILLHLFLQLRIVFFLQFYRQLSVDNKLKIMKQNQALLAGKARVNKTGINFKIFILIFWKIVCNSMLYMIFLYD